MLVYIGAGRDIGETHMFLGGFFVGMMVTALLAMWLHRRELRRIQARGMDYLDYLLGDANEY